MKEGRFDDELFEMLLRFDTVMSRLRATQNRSKNIHFYLLSPDVCAEKALSFTEKDSYRKDVNRNYTAVPFRNIPRRPRACPRRWSGR